MIKITLRDFRLNATKYLDAIEDGLILTIYGEDKYLITSLDGKNVLTDAEPNVLTQKPKIITPEVLASFRRVETCAWIGCSKEIVGHDKINGRGFCKEHI